jgi:uncharacterized membrane protein
MPCHLSPPYRCAMESREQPEDVVSSARLETFADGVFAIAITLLVLEIRIPDPGENVSRALVDLWPSFLAYVTSFLTIGTIWTDHHRLFTVIRGTTHGFLFVNILLLMPIAFLPYPTAVVARQWFEGKDQVVPAMLLYGGTMALVAIMFRVMWLYASSRGLLVAEAASSRAVRRRGELIYRLAPLIYLLRAAASVIDPILSLIVFLGLAVYWLSPSRRGANSSRP